MSRRARNRAAAAALIVFVAGVVLATGQLSGTFALFSAETENQNSAFAGDWVAAPTGLGAPTVSGLGASLAWTHATHGVTGQEIWYADQATTTNCTGVTYAGLVTGASLSATANSISGTGSPNDAVPSGDNGDNICFQIRSTHNAWYTVANFAVIQVGLVPTSLAYSGAGQLKTNTTITITYNQNVSYSGGTITVCTFTNGVVLLGDTGCGASSDTPTIGTLAGGTSSKTTNCVGSTVGTSGTQLTVTLKSCSQPTNVSGTATYTAAGSSATSSTGGASQCTKSNCKPTLTY